MVLRNQDPSYYQTAAVQIPSFNGSGDIISLLQSEGIALD